MISKSQIMEKFFYLEQELIREIKYNHMIFSDLFNYLEIEYEEKPSTRKLVKKIVNKPNEKP